MSHHWESETAKRKKPVVRRIRETDRPTLRDIDAAFSLKPWSEDDWIRETSAFGAGILVACQSRMIGSLIQGFALFNMMDDEFQLRRIVVRELCRRNRVASTLLEHFEATAHSASGVKHTIGEEPIERLTCSVPEESLDLQLTLAFNGYTCNRIIKNLNDAPSLYQFEKPLITSEEEP